MDLVAVANAGDITEGTAKEITLPHCDLPLEMFVVRKNDRFYAYLNRCPHTGVSLNWQPDQFFDIEHEYIQCATHGALFTVETGYCVRGPCAGAYLQAITLIVKDGRLYCQSNVL